MPCYHPLTAYSMPYYAAGKQCNEISFKPCSDSNKITLPCGQCVGCRLEKSRQWAVRCMHEAQMHEKNCFITLTYDDDNLPSDRSLHHEHFQKFIRSLRKRTGIKLRYYMAGEYGEKFDRPHFHACIFGYDFSDKKFWDKTPAGSILYRSSYLESIWTYGYSSVGDVTFESAAYVARYIMKKITGKPQQDHYTDQETGVIRQPEYNKMSLKPGIGKSWLDTYETDVYPNDYVVVRGKKVRPPKYYDKIFHNKNPYQFEELLYKRELSAKLNHEENTVARLAVKEQVTTAKLQKLKRNLK